MNIFNNRTKTFDYVEDLSGYELEANKIEKTLSTYVKSGFGWNENQIIHFNKNGKVKFTEVIEREIIHNDIGSEFVKTTYEKIINKKVVETQIDTTKFDGW